MNMDGSTHSLPPLDSIYKAYRSQDDVRQYTRHNVRIWRDIAGATELATKYPLEFDPRRDYWSMTERRVLVAYFAKRFRECYQPAATMRRLAFKTFRHFETARRDGRFGEVELANRHSRGWQGLLADIEAVGRELPDLAEYRELGAFWRHLKQDGLKPDFLEFLDEIRTTDDPDTFEPMYLRRLSWFPYLGLKTIEELPRRQTSFAVFYALFSSTNAYQLGGRLAFASILQNNPAKDLVGYALRWAKGERPDRTGFTVVDRNDSRDRSHYAPVLELYGFLNLDRQPFYNGAAYGYDSFARDDDQTLLERVERVGEQTRAFLDGRPELVSQLGEEFRKLIAETEQPDLVRMEGSRNRGSHTQVEGDAVDPHIAQELSQAARDRAERLTANQAGKIAFHIMLDAILYAARPEPGPGPVQTPSPAATGRVRETSEVHRPVEATNATVIDLPLALVPKANDALAYLRAGFHVLLAGAPGTGKTTIGQIVGFAWNSDLAQVPTRIPLAEAPVTTVANSAWAPFHTIGGILPDREGKFIVQQGIFIDPEPAPSGEWSLRPECLVLDEMNRADLDRCVGELYPLLTHSVAAVTPAGIPGVRRIHDNPRFRLVATVNDATIDDIVFPISEGLARRFVRIELRGATAKEVHDFLLRQAEGEGKPRYEAAAALVTEFFTRCAEDNRVKDSVLGEYLPFGVGYFELLAVWVAGRLSLSQEFRERDLREQALEILTTGLRSATRDRGYEAIFTSLHPPEAAG